MPFDRWMVGECARNFHLLYTPHKGNLCPEELGPHTHRGTQSIKRRSSLQYLRTLYSLQSSPSTLGCSRRDYVSLRCNQSLSSPWAVKPCTTQNAGQQLNATFWPSVVFVILFFCSRSILDAPLIAHLQTQ